MCHKLINNLISNYHIIEHDKYLNVTVALIKHEKIINNQSETKKNLYFNKVVNTTKKKFTRSTTGVYFIYYNLL